MNRLDAAFDRLRKSGEIGLFPYLMAGFPDPVRCGELLEAMASAGADGIELAVPFSDPLADGTTIQRVGAVALEQGASIPMALDLLRAFRAKWQTPVALMSYYNPILAHGAERLAREGAEAGLDGLIVPDLPLEEAEPLRACLRAEGLHLVSLIAPTSTDARIAQAAEQASGFLYCVSLVGVTGARRQLSDELPAFLRRVRASCPQPLVVGFGISRPEQVRALHGLADGVIVASALVDLLDSTPSERWVPAVEAYLRELKDAARAPATAPPG